MERPKVGVEEIRTLENSNSDVEELSANSASSALDDGSSGGPGGPGGDGSTSAGQSHGTGSNGGDDQENLYFAKKENKRVRNLKFLVILILFLVTTAVCLAVYFVTANGQNVEFEATFEGNAAKVISNFEAILEQKIAAIAALGVTLTAYAMHENSTWPFVTMDNFQQRSASTRSLSGAYFMELLPIVQEEERIIWEEYAIANKGWLSEGREYQEKYSIGAPEKQRALLEDGDAVTGDVVATFTKGNSSISQKIFTFDESFNVVIDPGPGPYYPIWQSSPILPEPRDLVNYNVIHYPQYGRFINVSANTGQIAIGGLDTAKPGDIFHPDLPTSFFAFVLSSQAGKYIKYTGEPMSSVYVPVVDSFEDDRKTVAIILAVIKWSGYFENVLSPNSQPILVVLENNCEGPYTYEIQGPQVKFIGRGNLANQKFKDLARVVHLDGSQVIVEQTTIALTLNQDICQYSLSVYPTDEMYEHHNDIFPLAITMTVAAVFILTAAVFIVYDMMVEKRQRMVLDTAKRSTAIVSSIFPKNVRDQLMGAPVQGNATKLRSLVHSSKTDQAFMDGSQRQEYGIGNLTNNGPIADLFPECTVMFGDVEGFTAWSSVREPSQVFTLLETIYAAFDRVASRRRVFKVETVGDCYVAVSGLPDPRKDHAVTMARFARDCINEHMALSKQLELTLGPETGDLRIRIGLHSGPITAGVLRGERSRFQLFGDTVNTAARLESSGEGNQIHISEQTAQLIIAAGHEHWVREREDFVHLKGKGAMKTYWLTLQQKRDRRFSGDGRAKTSSFDVMTSNEPSQDSVYSLKKHRLVSWNVDVLVRLIKQIVANRDFKKEGKPPRWSPKGTNPLDEVVEVIELPEKNKHGMRRDPMNVDLDPLVIKLVHEYVSSLAELYRDNHFHCFEHASHVTMSVAKLLSRIVAPSDMDFTDDEQAISTLHDHTYGITSDPLTQFACVLSALIHDVDHQGVPNATLINESDPLTERYGGKSLAEQNSVDQAWDLLMTEQYKPLVAVICHDDQELARFRQLVVNSVMATDIMDKDLKDLRNKRWDKAFNRSDTENNDTSREAVNRKATIVIEHLIQASDVSHTMQHWNVYQKWNARLFREMYKAWKDGRGGAKDPSGFWYQGEIGFFDFYIIPLARKLKDCGVFGVSSDEYLQYAINNRNEWERKGQSVVEALIAEVNATYNK